MAEGSLMKPYWWRRVHPTGIPSPSDIVDPPPPSNAGAFLLGAVFDAAVRGLDLIRVDLNSISAKSDATVRW